jgi:hypothetical protein
MRIPMILARDPKRIQRQQDIVESVLPVQSLAVRESVSYRNDPKPAEPVNLLQKIFYKDP